MVHEQQASEPEQPPDSEGRRPDPRRGLFNEVTLALVIVAALVWLASDVLLLVFACILLAILLYDLSCRLRARLHLPHGLALLIVVLVVGAILGGGGSVMAPSVAEQSRELARAVPEALQGLQETLKQYPLLDAAASGMPAPEKLAENVASLLPRAGLFFSGVLGVIANIAIVLFVAIYLAAQPHLYIDGLVTLVPQPRRGRARQVLDTLGHTLGQWLAGKALSMLVVGILTTVGLAVIGIPLALVLGIIAGLLDFIPYVGPIAAGVPAVLIAFTESPLQAGYVALLFLAIQVVEGYLLMPLIERRTVSLPPALTIVMQVLLGSLFGFAGVALATPLVAVMAVLVAMLYVQDVLGDPVRMPGEQ